MCVDTEPISGPYQSGQSDQLEVDDFVVGDFVPEVSVDVRFLSGVLVRPFPLLDDDLCHRSLRSLNELLLYPTRVLEHATTEFELSLRLTAERDIHNASL